MAPLDQIKKLAGSVLFNQILYPRERFICDSQTSPKNEVGQFQESYFGELSSKISFAIEWCRKHPGPVLDLANPSEQLALVLVQQGLATSTLESSPSRIVTLRNSREQLTESQKQLFEIYPFDFSKFDIDQTFQTVFSSAHVIEEAESEISILGGLRNVLSHLKSDGDFFAEVHNLDFFEAQSYFHVGTWRYLENISWVDGVSRVWERTYPGNKESQTIFEYATSNELSEFSSYRSTLHLFNQDQWMKLFEVAGFLVEDCFGNWKGAEANSQYPHLIFHLKSR